MTILDDVKGLYYNYWMDLKPYIQETWLVKMRLAERSQRYVQIRQLERSELLCLGLNMTLITFKYYSDERSATSQNGV